MRRGLVVFELSCIFGQSYCYCKTSHSPETCRCATLGTLETSKPGPCHRPQPSLYTCDAHSMQTRHRHFKAPQAQAHFPAETSSIISPNPLKIIIASPATSPKSSPSWGVSLPPRLQSTSLWRKCQTGKVDEDSRQNLDNCLFCPTAGVFGGCKHNPVLDEIGCSEGSVAWILGRGRGLQRNKVCLEAV